MGKDGQIWFGVTGHGVYRLNPNDLNTPPKLIINDPEMKVTYLESQANHRLLIGTEIGLFTFDISKKKLKLIKTTRTLYIKSIHVFENDRIWFTVHYKGLMLLEKEALISFPLDKNKYLASPHCVIDDGRGFFWIPTNQGLFQVAVKDLLSYAESKNAKSTIQPSVKNKTPHPELFYMYHDMDEGFNTNEFNGSCQPCAVKLANGHISLPSLNGLVWFKPTQINNYFPDGDFILHEVEVNRRPVHFKGDSVHFPPSPEHIRLHFTTAYFGNHHNLNLSYALVKQDVNVEAPTWIPIDNYDIAVRYSSLGSGHYTLIVRKQNGFGIDNYSFKKIHLVVPPLWYETTWAIIIFIIAAVLITYCYIVYRLRSVRLENARLEEIIVKRTARLNQTLHELRESKNDMSQQIHLLTRLFASITHDVQSPLRYISFTSSNISEMIAKNQLNKAASLGTAISELSGRTSDMLKDLLDYIKVQVYGNNMQFEDIHIKKLVEDKLELFKNVATSNASHFVNDVSSEKIIFSNYQFLSIIVHNLIDNATKYTYNGTIRIYTQTNEQHKTELVISNTGIGIPSYVIEIINSPIKDKKFNNLTKNGKIAGLGLLIVKEISEMAGITIKVTQTDVTSFHLCFR